jgi:haloalkane dehalogenase
VREAYLKPYGSWADRIAVHRFVQDIPARPGDPAFDAVEETGRGLWRLSNVPLLVVWGGRDFVFDLDFFEEWRRRFPRAQFRLIQDAGHYVLEDAPEALPLIREFLALQPAPSEP